MSHRDRLGLLPLNTYVVITPVRNEASRIAKTINSMVAQTIRPMKWVIVDDGSSDDTPKLLDRTAELYPWIMVIHRPDRGARKPGGGVVEAFYDGYPIVVALEWRFLVKLDGDLSFASDYFERCLAEFDSDERLGIGGGAVCVLQDSQPRLEAAGDPPFHVRGATKIYRRECWEQIGPLLAAPGWDTVDEVTANMKGWATRTFQSIPVLQLKETGAADGSWRNWFKNGRGCYMCGYDPVFMLAKCLKRAAGRPFIIPGLALAAGFCSGYLARVQRPAESEVIRYLRRQQRRRLVGNDSIYG